MDPGALGSVGPSFQAALMDRDDRYPVTLPDRMKRCVGFVLR
jgi:hypothetical protein